MIVVDTSALMAILLDEPEAAACIDAIAAADTRSISATTVAEALIVTERRGCGPAMRRLMEGAGFSIAPVTSAMSRRVAEAYARWGKGIDPAGLNFGDCFAYVLASDTASPLLFVGDDFAATDLEPAITPTPTPTP